MNQLQRLLILSNIFLANATVAIPFKVRVEESDFAAKPIGPKSGLCDKPSNLFYSDFSIKWDIVDNGDYSTVEALALAENFTNASVDILEGYKIESAKNLFNEFCKDMCEEILTGFCNVTLRASLKRSNGNETLMSRIFYVKPEGTTVRIPTIN